MIHELKIQSKYFYDIVEKTKTFELRKNDRDYKVGDLLALNEISDDKTQYTGISVLCEVTYILDLKDWLNDSEGYVILGIFPCWVESKGGTQSLIHGEPRTCHIKDFNDLRDSIKTVADALRERFSFEITADTPTYYSRIANTFDGAEINENEEDESIESNEEKWVVTRYDLEGNVVDKEVYDSDPREGKHNDD